MADTEVWIGFFEDVGERDGKLDFNGHFATGIRLPSRDMPIGEIHCVVFGRVRFRDEVPYRLRISYLGSSANNNDPPYDEAGVVPRSDDVEGEWTFQLDVGITDLKFDADFVIRAEAEVGDARAMAHLKIAASTDDLNALTPLLAIEG